MLWNDGPRAKQQERRSDIWSENRDVKCSIGGGVTTLDSNLYVCNIFSLSFNKRGLEFLINVCAAQFFKCVFI